MRTTNAQISLRIRLLDPGIRFALVNKIKGDIVLYIEYNADL